MKLIRPVLLLSAAAILFTGCGKTESESGPKPLKLAFLTNNAAPFWTIARAGCEDGAKAAGNVKIDFRIPATASAAEQQQLIDDLLAKGVDGLALSPIDPANQTDILNKAAAQTLVITADSDAPKSNRVSYIGTDNKAAGREAGKLLKAALPSGGKIMVFVGSLDAQNAADRLAGIKEEISGSGIEVVDVRTDETDRVRAKTNVQDTLVKYPDIAGLVGLWSYNGPAIWAATKEAGKTGKVKIVVFDEEEETLAGVAAGDIFGTVVQQPYEFGKQAIELMAKKLRGDNSVFPASGVIVVPTISIQKDNVAEFQAKLKKLLNP
jgi:ribose transport system substrate-binding protein